MKNDVLEDNTNFHEADTDMSIYDARSPKSNDATNSDRPPMDHYGISDDMEYSTQMLNLLAEYTGDQATAFEQGLLKPEERSRLPLPITDPSPSAATTSPNLPGFIKPLSYCIASDELEYLQSKGALTLPEEEFQNALIWSFFEYVYPYMPVVDLEEFLEPVYNRDGSSGQISLLLFQAVLFAGTAHVKMDHLNQVGFKTRREARKAFFLRVRLLYDFNTECDRAALVQALLLMTLWYETPTEHRNTWHWIDVAISQAFAAGLHREPALSRSPPPARVQKLHRRLWWACLVRDRLVSLGMKRTPRIKDDDYCVTMLEETDFKQERLKEKNSKQLQRMCSYIQDRDKRATLAGLCIAQAKLCLCLNYYLRSRYSIFTENSGNETAEVFRISKPDDKAAFLSCNEGLVAWKNTLPEPCTYRPLSRDILGRVDTTIALHRTILHMTYCASISALHRSRFTLLLHDADSSLFDQELSKIWMQHAAIQISDMASDVHKHGLDGLLPTMSLSVVVSAAAVHLLEIRGVIQSNRKRAQEGYRRCMLVIDSLTEMYVVADLAKDAMEWAFVTSPSRGLVSNDDLESTLPSSQSPTIVDTVPFEAGDCSKNYMPLSLPSVGITKPGLSLCDARFSLGTSSTDLSGEWLDYPAEEMEGLESCVLFGEGDV
ncbi:hypothetical protein QQX98_009561 [Neonectria punicea]|uniref:Xylanolytic transcriptional activator regulatory domain-containing protein n=1 Tax=Neonectria punicea TaxID=979145 RepID=A0ABR1GSD6_9HYPO